jgi:hypothetical protein
MSTGGPKIPATPKTAEHSHTPDQFIPTCVSGRPGPSELDNLAQRCMALEDPAAQGEPMTRLDYLLLLLATVLLPVILILVGSRL